METACLLALFFFFLFFSLPSRHPKLFLYSKSFCDRYPIAATLPAMKHSQDALQCNTAVQQTRLEMAQEHVPSSWDLFPLHRSQYKHGNKTKHLPTHQTECSNFHLRDNDAYMPKCDIIENLGLAVKAAVLKLFFIENFTLHDSFSEHILLFYSWGFQGVF